MTSLYLLNPLSASGFHEIEDGVLVADLALVTVAAMAPKHWHVEVVDEAISPVDLATKAKFVGLTGKTGHLLRMIELATEFRRRGKTVLIGGPLASLEPDALRPYADILVIGELEDIAEQLFADLEASSWQATYIGGRADIRRSPVPRWELYPTARAVNGALQTTRGCPFDCEFCDVIQYQGRKQRHKDIPQVVAELDALYAAGFRSVFLCDDNFTVHRQFARSMLDVLTAWNDRHADDPMIFNTQASLDLARDTDLIDRCVRAGLTAIFVGLETINEASLRETNKKQNLLLPMQEAVRRMVSRGIALQAGVITGFDHDGPGIFSELYDFFQASPLPDLMIGTLKAPFGTPLYARMKREGRLVDGRYEGVLGDCNFIPAQMSREELVRGTRRLSLDIYSAPAFKQRVLNFIECFGSERPAEGSRPRGKSERTQYALTILRRVAARGAEEASMVTEILGAAADKPATLGHVLGYLTRFESVRSYVEQFRHEELGPTGGIPAPAL